MIGRPAKPRVPAAVSKGLAQEILDAIAAETWSHEGGCRCLKCRWRALAFAKDERLRFTVEDKLLDRILGRPANSIVAEHGFDPNQPLRVIVEHIGGSAHKAPAPAK